MPTPGSPKRRRHGLGGEVRQAADGRVFARVVALLTGQDGPVVHMSREDFEDAVRDALDEVPDELAAMTDNLVVLVEDDPPSGEPDLLGLYEGVPLTERGEFWATGALPDRITVFRRPTLAICRRREEVVEEVLVTVVHEIAHHFGIDDDRLHALGWD